MPLVEFTKLRRSRPRLEADTGLPHRCGFRYVVDTDQVLVDGTAPVTEWEMFQINMGDHEWTENIENVGERTIRGDGTINLPTVGVRATQKRDRTGDVTNPDKYGLVPRRVPEQMVRHDRKMPLDMDRQALADRGIILPPKRAQP